MRDAHSGDDMCEEESLICHLPDDPKATQSKDSKAYQTDETLLSVQPNSHQLSVPIVSNLGCIRIVQSYRYHKRHLSTQ
jgi:hypothetical protein